MQNKSISNINTFNNFHNRTKIQKDKTINTLYIYLHIAQSIKNIRKNDGDIENIEDLVIYWDRPNNGQINSKQRQNTDRNVYIQEMAGSLPNSTEYWD